MSWNQGQIISVIGKDIGMLCPSCKTLLEEFGGEIGFFKRLVYCRGCNIYYPVDD